MFAVAADRTWSDFPLSPFYLPVIHQIVQFGTGVGTRSHYLWCASTLPLEPHLPDATVDTVLERPNGERLPVRSSIMEGRLILHVEDLNEAGLYRMTRPGDTGPTPALAVNVAREESDLTPLDAATVRELLGLKRVYVAHDEEELLSQIEESRVGKVFGEQLLWVVLALAAGEFIYASATEDNAPLHPVDLAGPGDDFLLSNFMLSDAGTLEVDMIEPLAKLWNDATGEWHG